MIFKPKKNAGHRIRRLTGRLIRQEYLRKEGNMLRIVKLPKTILTNKNFDKPKTNP